MWWSHLQLIGHFLQTTVQVFTAFHQILDIIIIRKIYFVQLKEFALICRQRETSQHLEEVAKVVAATKPQNGLTTRTHYTLYNLTGANLTGAKQS